MKNGENKVRRYLNDGISMVGQSETVMSFLEEHYIRRTFTGPK
jgi:hypothetical protein